MGETQTGKVGEKDNIRKRKIKQREEKKDDKQEKERRAERARGLANSFFHSFPISVGKGHRQILKRESGNKNIV